MLERQKHGQPNEVQHKTDKRYCKNERKKLISPSNVGSAMGRQWHSGNRRHNSALFWALRTKKW